ncbi:MAG: hypothetical protein K8I01_11745 [Candidatus Methylomirabilis sp.]|nr:hypothetical protein [Deltaproteobacteria bacterium]
MAYTSEETIRTYPRRASAFALIVLASAVVFLLLVLVVDSRMEIIRNSDDGHYFSYARSAVIDRDMDLLNEYERLGIKDFRLTPAGLPANKYSIGLPLAVLPFYALTHMAVLALNALGSGLDSSGYSIPYQLSFSLGSIFYGYFGLLISYRLARRYYPEAVSFLSAASIFLASNLVYYFIREPFMSHLVSFFAAALFFYMWSVTREGEGGKRAFFVMGLSAGLMVITRQQDAVFLMVPLVDGVIGFIKERRLPWFLTARGLFPFVAGLVPAAIAQALVWKLIFGSFLVYSYGGESFIYAASPKIIEVLFSSKHGLLSWNPVIILALIGVGFFIKYERRPGTLLLIAFLLQLYVNASWFMWWFGHSFGHRAFISSLPIFIIGLAAFFEKLDRKGLLAWGIGAAVLLSAWNMVMMLAYLSEMIPYADYFSWKELFLKLLDLPEAVFRKALSIS